MNETRTRLPDLSDLEQTCDRLAGSVVQILPNPLREPVANAVGNVPSVVFASTEAIFSRASLRGQAGRIGKLVAGGRSDLARRIAQSDSSITQAYQELSAATVSHHEIIENMRALHLGASGVKATTVCFEAGVIHDLTTYIKVLDPDSEAEIALENLGPYFNQNSSIFKVSGSASRFVGQDYRLKTQEKINAIYPDEDNPTLRYLMDASTLGTVLYASQGLDLLASFKYLARSQNTAHTKVIAGNIVTILGLLSRPSGGDKVRDYKLASSKILASTAALHDYVLARVPNLRPDDAQFITGSLVEFRETAFHLGHHAKTAARLTGRMLISAVETTDVPAGETVITEGAEVMQVDQAKKEQDLAEVMTQAEVLSKEINKLNGAWSISSKELRRRGLSDAQGALVRGFKIPSGMTTDMSGRSKFEAQSLIGRIEHLSEIVDACRGVQAFLSYCVDSINAQEEFCANALAALSAIIAESLSVKQQDELSAKVPSLLRINGVLDDIRGDWDAYKVLIADNWPDGISVVRKIESVLFTENTGVVPDRSIAAQVETQELTGTALEDVLEIKRPLVGIAEQLDEIILPSDATAEAVEREIRKLDIPEEEKNLIDWQRLRDLVTIRDIYDGRLYRSKEGSLGHAPPYYVAVIEYAGDTYAIAESPVQGNATYIVAERLADGNWLEVLSESKYDARVYGAHRIIHRSGRTTPDHLEKIKNKLLDLMTVKG